jgi:hypothetical protein
VRDIDRKRGSGGELDSDGNVENVIELGKWTSIFFFLTATQSNDHVYNGHTMVI